MPKWRRLLHRIDQTPGTTVVAPPPSLLAEPRTVIDESDQARLVFLSTSAGLHLDRANTLAKTEWNVTLLFWGALLTSGISFIAYSSRSSPPMAVYIAHHDYIVLMAYALASAIFLLGFSINQARSIIEARSQYQMSLNAASMIASLAPIARTGSQFPGPAIDTRYTTMTRNIVWKTKVLSTFLFTSGIWMVTQVMAHGNISVSTNVELNGQGQLRIVNGIDPEAISIACAFADCGRDNRFDIGRDPLETGTVLWVCLALLVAGLWLRTVSADKVDR